MKLLRSIAIIGAFLPLGMYPMDSPKVKRRLTEDESAQQETALKKERIDPDQKQNGTITKRKRSQQEKDVPDTQAHKTYKSATHGLSDNEKRLFEAVAQDNRESLLTALQAGASLDATDEDGYTALHRTVEHNQPWALQMLVTAGADHEATTPEGETPLLIAAKNGQTQCVIVLLTKGAKTDATDEQGRTALHFAAMKGNEELVRTLVAKNPSLTTKKDSSGLLPTSYAMKLGKSINCINILENARFSQEFPDETLSTGAWTEVHLAAWHGDAPTLTTLLENGADSEAQDQFQSTALEIAAVGNNLECVTILLDHNADANVQNRYGNTPLHRTSSPEISTALIEAGARTDVTNKVGMNPLHCAAAKGNEELVKTLVAKNPSLTTCRDSSGLLPTSYAAKFRKSINCINILENARFSQEFPDAAPPTGAWTELHLAAWHGDAPTLTALLESGADTEARNQFQATALYLAAVSDNLECVKILLDHNADANVQVSNVTTPLHATSSPEISTALIEAGARTDATDKLGMRPLDHAARNGNDEFIRTLVDKDASLTTKRHGRSPLTY